MFARLWSCLAPKRIPSQLPSKARLLTLCWFVWCCPQISVHRVLPAAQRPSCVSTAVSGGPPPPPKETAGPSSAQLWHRPTGPGTFCTRTQTIQHTRLAVAYHNFHLCRDTLHLFRSRQLNYDSWRIESAPQRPPQKTFHNTQDSCHVLYRHEVHTMAVSYPLTCTFQKEALSWMSLEMHPTLPPRTYMKHG